MFKNILFILLLLPAFSIAMKRIDEAQFRETTKQQLEKAKSELEKALALKEQIGLDFNYAKEQTSDKSRFPKTFAGFRLRLERIEDEIVVANQKITALKEFSKTISHTS